MFTLVCMTIQKSFFCILIRFIMMVMCGSHDFCIESSSDHLVI